jgi:hypothetical protein
MTGVCWVFLVHSFQDRRTRRDVEKSSRVEDLDEAVHPLYSCTWLAMAEKLPQKGLLKQISDKTYVEG